MTALELAQMLINHFEETAEQDAEWIQDWFEEQSQAIRQERDALRAEAAVLREALEVTLREAQILRVNQLQCCNEFGWPQNLRENCDKAWARLNEVQMHALQVAQEADEKSGG